MISNVKQKNFRPFPLGPIPEDWRVVKLGEVVEIYDHKRIPLSEMERGKRKGEYPYCGANGIIDFIDDYIFDGEYVLLAEDGGAYGKFEKSAYIMTGKFWINNHAHVLKAIDNKLNNWFLMYVLNFSDLRPYIVGSTRTKLNQDQMKNIKIPLPPLSEQKRIAEVLRTVDEAILKVEQEIEHTERLKQGLMQHLLSRGIGHTRFKDSPIGKIPEEWDVVRLGEVAEYFQYGFTAKAENEPVGPKFLRITDIQDGKVNWSSVPYCRIDDNLLKKFELKSGDILFARIGATTGKSFLIKECPKTIFASYLIRCRVNLNKAFPEFLFIYTQSSMYWNQIHSIKGGRLKQGINLPQIQGLLIPLPPLPEQKKIAEILMTVDRKLELLRQKKVHLERIKKGLMNDLLTGKKRLKVNLEDDT